MGRPKIPESEKKIKVGFTIDPYILNQIKKQPKNKRSQFVNKLLRAGLEAIKVGDKTYG